MSLKQARRVPRAAPVGGDQVLCPLCNSPSIHNAIPDAPLLKKCSACRIVFNHPFPQASGEVYDQDYYRIWNEEEYKKRLRLWARRLRTVKKFCSAGRLLDIGTGDGLFVRLAREAGFDASGTETSPAAVEAAMKWHHLEVALAPIEETKFPDNFFDVITLWHVIEHVRDPLGLVVKGHRLLKPGGFFFCATPNLNKYLSRACYRATHLKPFPFYSPRGESHVFHFTEDTLLGSVKKAGFIIKFVGADFAAVRLRPQTFESLSYILSVLSGRNWNENLLLVAQK